MYLSSTSSVRQVTHDPAPDSRPFSREEAADYLSKMARLGKVCLTTRVEPEAACVEMEIVLVGIVVLKGEALLDAAGFKRLQGLMAATSLLEL